jgi:hypothetical protein
LAATELDGGVLVGCPEVVEEVEEELVEDEVEVVVEDVNNVPDVLTDDEDEVGAEVELGVDEVG